ncbi:ATP-dependent DNA helicase Q4 isoform 2-T2 [Morphnus guianensis]
MERRQEVKALLKRWEADFLRERRRKPSQADIEAAPEDTRRLYKEYKMLKQQREESDPSWLSPSCQPAAPEQVPESGCWGAHLNRQPKTPRLSRRSCAVPKASAQYYGMKLKSNLGAAGKETPLTPRRTPTARQTLAVPGLQTNLGTSDKATAPVEASQSERGEPGDLLLPPSVSGLAPIVLSAGLKPPLPPPPNKFQQLKRTVAQRLGSLDPAWLRRCQGTLGDEGAIPGATREREQGEIGCAPPEQEGIGEIPSVEDSGRKRPRGDGRDGAAAPTKLRRCHRDSAKATFGAASGLKQSEEEEKEEEKRAAAQKESGKVSDPSENILGELEEEEEEKPRPTRRAGAARAPPQRGGNFVRLNLKKKSYVRGYALRGNRLRKQVWKQKWKKKAERFGGGSGSIDRSSDVCFRCGGTGHWASACQGRETAAGPLPEEGGWADEEEEAPLPTLEEVARRTNTICQELSFSENGTSDQERSEKILEATTYLDVRRPAYEPPAPPAPMEPLYGLGPEGKVRETPEEVFEALKALGYSSFRPGQEVTVMRILSGLSTLVVLSTGMGKSLCYQLPAYLYHRRSQCLTLVISPLVSLMDDQVSGLPPCLKAVCIHSNMTKAQREAVMEKVRQGEVQVLLLSPEALVGGSGSGSSCLPSADQLPAVAFACIDEAHCVSEWSHNFRPCYLQLCKVLRDRLGVRCFLGLTATATLATARDVAQHLGIPAEEGIAVRSAAVPPNLHLSVSMDRDRDQALIALLQGERFGCLDSIIVYCTRREETARIAALIRTCLQGMLLKEPAGAQEPGRDAAERKKAKAKKSVRRPLKWIADAYHAGLSAAERRRVQKSFMSGQLRVVVATVAFGMGLDKSDVRGVVHYNMPKNFESYVQEIGRAGRDGEPAHCHLFLEPEVGPASGVWGGSPPFWGSSPRLTTASPGWGSPRAAAPHLRRHGGFFHHQEAGAEGFLSLQVLGAAPETPGRHQGRGGGGCRNGRALGGGGQRQRRRGEAERAAGVLQARASHPHPTNRGIPGHTGGRHRDPPVLPGAAPAALAGAAASHLLLLPAPVLQGTPAAPDRGTEFSPHRRLPGPGAPGREGPQQRQLPGIRRGLAERLHGLGSTAGETRPAPAPVGSAPAARYRHARVPRWRGGKKSLLRCRQPAGSRWVPDLGGHRFNQLLVPSDGRSKGKSGVVVEFGELSFHLRAYGDLTDQELDSVCDFLHRRVVAREKMALGQLRACFQAFQSVAFQTCGPHPADEEEERSSCLKALLSDYFEKEPAGEQAERGCEEEEEEEEDLGDAKLRDWESQIRADIRHFLAIRQDEKFSGRAVARIFHGIGSPCFPAQVYGRDRRFWRRYLTFDFHQLARLATEEILASR